MTNVRTNNKKSVILIEDKNTAFLVEEGCRLDKEMKVIKEQLDGIKVELEVLSPGKYRTEEGGTVTISESPKYSEISPEEAKAALRAKRLGRSFLECVTVSVTKIKRFLSDQEIDELRTVISQTRKHSFK